MTMWKPRMGDVVWFNYPDSEGPTGEVVGFVPNGHARAGQPIIAPFVERRHRFTGKRYRLLLDDRKVTHPMFLLPFPLLSPEWEQANAEGLVGS